MDKSLIIIFCFLITFVIQSCEEDKIEQNPSSTIYFDLEKSNSDNNYSITVDQLITTAEKTSSFQYGADSVMLIRQILLNLQLTNGDSINFGFWLIAYEEPELLNLGEYDSVYFKGEDWDYLNYDNEISNFYNGFREARVLIDNNVIYHNDRSDYFEILEAEEIFIEGKNKTYLEIRFKGMAYGWYDPTGKFQEVFSIKDGIFKGFLE